MKIKQLCILSVCIVLLNGCAVFKGGNVPYTSLSSVNLNEQRPSINYSIRAQGGMGTTRDLLPMQQRIVEDEFVQVLNDSLFFDHVSSHNPNADLKLDVTMTNSGNPAALIPAFITGLSLYTIPSWATDQYEVQVTATTKNHRRKYVLSDSTKLVQWLPMIFAFPVNNFSTIPEVRRNMYRNILSQIQNDGLLAPSEKNTSVEVESATSKLKDLKEIHEKGLINAEEYKNKKSAIIDAI